jgi:transposase-like protein
MTYYRHLDMEKPTNLAEAMRYYSDLDVATEYVAGLRWPDGFVCPHCGGREYSYVSTRRLWKCTLCKKQSSVKVGTLFEGSALGLDKWLPAIWLAANPQTGMSSHELARALGTTQKSAWFMLHRIRDAAAWETEAATLPEPPTRTAPPVSVIRFRPEPRPWLFVTIALGFFALGAVFGRLTSRADT